MSAPVAEAATLAAAKQAMLEKRLQALKAGGTTQSGIPRVSREQPLPLSFAQERLWFLDQLQRGNPAYNLVDAWRLKGPVQIELLEQAFNEVVQRHESLRTGFSHGADGHPLQIVRAATNLRIARRDLGEVPVELPETTLQRLASDEA